MIDRGLPLPVFEVTVRRRQDVNVDAPTMSSVTAAAMSSIPAVAMSSIPTDVDGVSAGFADDVSPLSGR